MADKHSVSENGNMIRLTGKGIGNKTSVKAPVLPKTSINHVQILGRHQANNIADDAKKLASLENNKEEIGITELEQRAGIRLPASLRSHHLFSIQIMRQRQKVNDPVRYSIKDLEQDKKELSKMREKRDIIRPRLIETVSRDETGKRGSVFTQQEVSSGYKELEIQIKALEDKTQAKKEFNEMVERRYRIKPRLIEVGKFARSGKRVYSRYVEEESNEYKELEIQIKAFREKNKHLLS